MSARDVATFFIVLSICSTAFAGATPLGSEPVKPSPQNVPLPLAKDTEDSAPLSAEVPPEEQSYTEKGIQRASHTLNRNCRAEGYACGECETGMQTEFDKILASMTGTPAETEHWGAKKLPNNTPITSNMTMDQFLEKTATMMRKGSPNGKLNYITIGSSQSLHGTTPGNPRVAMKSPDGELWVTFNTDPKAPGYNKVEIMRWNGKTARFDFEEIVFKEGGGGHVNQSATDCLLCHRKPARPIWDSYRAWPGVIPPRDDLLETDNPSSPPGKPDASARAYLDFMDRIAKAKSGGTGDPSAGRLRFLDIPVSGQLPAGTDQKPPEEQVNAIRDFVSKNGWYRIPHDPETRQLRSYDQKTARKAGSSHLAFDQLMGQNMCRIANDLRKHPDFLRLKYGIAYLLHCGELRGKGNDAKEMSAVMEDLFHPSVKKRAENYVRRYDHRFTDNTKMADGYTHPLSAFLQDTRDSFEEDNQAKSSLHHTYLVEYLQGKEGMPRGPAEAEAKSLSSKNFDARPPYTVIGDPGGVRGVAESEPDLVAALRYILEPSGMNVGDWSMSRGHAVAGGRSFQYSDQFLVTLKDQPAILAVLDENKGKNRTETCENLKKRSKQRSSVTLAPIPIPDPFASQEGNR